MSSVRSPLGGPHRLEAPRRSDERIEALCRSLEPGTGCRHEELELCGAGLVCSGEDRCEPESTSGASCALVPTACAHETYGSTAGVCVAICYVGDDRGHASSGAVTACAAPRSREDARSLATRRNALACDLTCASRSWARSSDRAQAQAQTPPGLRSSGARRPRSTITRSGSRTRSTIPEASRTTPAARRSRPGPRASTRERGLEAHSIADSTTMSSTYATDDPSAGGSAIV